MKPVKSKPLNLDLNNREEVLDFFIQNISPSNPGMVLIENPIAFIKLYDKALKGGITCLTENDRFDLFLLPYLGRLNLGSDEIC